MFREWPKLAHSIKNVTNRYVKLLTDSLHSSELSETFVYLRDTGAVQWRCQVFIDLNITAFVTERFGGRHMGK